MANEKILLVEGEEIIRKNLETQLRYRGYLVMAVPSLGAARAVLAREHFEAVVTDMALPDGSGMELLRDAQARADRPQVLMMSTPTDPCLAGECIRAGAFDFLTKPVSAQQVEAALKKAGEFEQMRKVNEFLSQNGADGEGCKLLGNSPAMQRVRELIRKVARTDATVLIQGESGTGKEVVARAIYEQSARNTAPFIAVNCAAVPENLIESEFFGHEKGSFTGAMTRREGRFELAHGGTIFLDEVSEVSTQVQAKLLRVLQERELQRVGGDRVIKVNVRVVASTNRNLRESIERKEFREDLYFRLNVVPICLPPLRERMEDLPALAEHFVARHARKHGVKVAGITASCMAAMRRHQWPGNVRELMNTLERAVILCAEGGYLTEEHLGFESVKAGVDKAPAVLAAAGAEGFPMLAGNTLPPPSSAWPEPVVLNGSRPEEFTGTDNIEAADFGMVNERLRQMEWTPEELSADDEAEDEAAMAREQDGGARPTIPLAGGSGVFGGSWPDRLPTLEEVERQLIFAALARCRENRTHAAKMIGVSLRTLRSRLAEYRQRNGGVTPNADLELAKFAVA